MSYQIDFIETIAPIVAKYAAQYGYKFISPILAQACLESNYGRSGLSQKAHNYFGLKCGSSWKGASINMATKEEYAPGTLTSIRDNFRKYSSLEEGIKGYFDFIQYPRYANLKEATSPVDYLTKIKADGYATSSTYVQSNSNLINTYALTEYDGKSEAEIKQMIAGTTKKATNATIVAEVIQLRWGVGQERVKKLQAAGYDATDVQKRVNEVLTLATAAKECLKSIDKEYWPLIIEQARK